MEAINYYFFFNYKAWPRKPGFLVHCLIHKNNLKGKIPRGNNNLNNNVKGKNYRGRNGNKEMRGIILK